MIKNDWKTIESRQTDNNRVRLFMLLKSLCGVKPAEWRKHENYTKALEIAHTVIFKREDDLADALGSYGFAVNCAIEGVNYVINRRCDLMNKRWTQYAREFTDAYDAGLLSKEEAAEGFNFLATVK